MSSSPYSQQQHSQHHHAPAYSSSHSYPQQQQQQYGYWYPPSSNAPQSSSVDAPTSASSGSASHHHLYSSSANGNGGSSGSGGGLPPAYHPSSHPSHHSAPFNPSEDPYSRGVTYPSGAPGGGDFAFYNAMPQNRYARLPDANDTSHLYPFPGGHPSIRPKRKQVKNACVNCQKACKKCDEGRPCTRCIRYGLQESCEDSKRKERKKIVRPAGAKATGTKASQSSQQQQKKTSVRGVQDDVTTSSSAPYSHSQSGAYNGSQTSSHGYYGSGSPHDANDSGSGTLSPAAAAGGSSFYSPASAPANVERFSGASSAPGPSYDRSYGSHHSLSSSYLPSMSSSYPAHDRSSSVPMSNSPALASPSLYHSRHAAGNSGALHSPSIMEHSSVFPNQLASSFYLNSQSGQQDSGASSSSSNQPGSGHYLGHGRYSSESALPLNGSPAYTTNSTSVTSTSPRVGILPSPPGFATTSSGSGAGASPYAHPAAPALPLPSNDGRPFVLKRPLPKRTTEASNDGASGSPQQAPRAVPRTLTSPQLRNAMDPPSRRYLDGPKPAGADGSVRA